MHTLVIKKKTLLPGIVNNDTPLPIADCLLSESKRKEAFVKEF